MPTASVDTTPPPDPKFAKRPAFWSSVKGRALIAAAIVTGTFLIGWAGYGIHAAMHPTEAVTVSTTFHGTVDLVNQSGNAGCVQADNHGPRVCSVLYVIGGKTLHVGDKVNAAHEWVPDRAGTKSDLLLIWTVADAQ